VISHKYVSFEQKRKMTTPQNEIEFSYKSAFAAIISMLFVYWLYQLIDVLSTLENNIMNLPYLIRMAITNLYPDDSEALINAHSKLKMFAYVFLITFLIKSFISVKQAFTSSISDSQSYILILFIIEGVFLYFNFNIKISEIIAILILPNIIIYGLLDN
jgi:hypothetical protein